MKVFAISDLHMSTKVNKPMNVFGSRWDNYIEIIFNDWKSKVSDDDAVIVPGDISWAMSLEDAKADLDLIGELPGKKIILKGNHDYWWNSLSKVNSIVNDSFFVLQNNCVRIGNVIVCGSRGWICPDGNAKLPADDEKIYLREVERLRLSFSTVKRIRENGDKLICVMHFPPFDTHRNDSGYTKLIEENGCDAVIYGHLHGKDSRADKILVKNGVKYYLTSCDIVGNKLVDIEL